MVIDEENVLFDTFTNVFYHFLGDYLLCFGLDCFVNKNFMWLFMMEFRFGFVLNVLDAGHMDQVRR